MLSCTKLSDRIIILRQNGESKDKHEFINLGGGGIEPSHCQGFLVIYYGMGQSVSNLQEQLSRIIQNNSKLACEGNQVTLWTYGYVFNLLSKRQ